MKLETTHLLLVYGITACAFFAIDLLWIGVVAKGFYAKYIGGIMRDQVNWAAALIFYFMYIGGIVLFVLIPALKNGSAVLHVISMGGLFGLIAYSTFDLTALALFLRLACYRRSRRHGLGNAPDCRHLRNHAVDNAKCPKTRCNGRITTNKERLKWITN